MHRSVLGYLRQRLQDALKAPESERRVGAIEELEEAISYIEDEAYIEDWGEELEDEDSL